MRPSDLELGRLVLLQAILPTVPASVKFQRVYYVSSLQVSKCYGAKEAQYS